MDNTQNNFQNSFPIPNSFPIDDKDKTGQPEKGRKNLSVLNVGQILLLIILFIIICLQAINLLFNPAQNITVAPLQSDIIRQLPEITVTAESAGQTHSVPDAPVSSDYAAEPDAADIISPPEPEVIFILGQSNGKLAILSADGQTVYETFNVYINTLPPIDRDLLLEGIKITATEELGSLLEDFTS